MQTEVMFAGFGGQGILTMGMTISYGAVDQGLETSWIPAYGPESRGGTSNCTVMISDTKIASPVTTTPGAVIVLNEPSFTKFIPRLKPGGVAVSNLWGSAVNPRFDSCISIIAEAFPHLYRFKSYTHNYIIVGDTKEEEIQPHELLVRAKKTMQKINFGFDLVELIRRQIL